MINGKSGWYDFSYNEHSDFLDVALTYQPSKCEAERVEDGIMVKKNPETDEVVGLWVYDFSKNYPKLRSVLERLKIRFPLRLAPDLSQTERG